MSDNIKELNIDKLKQELKLIVDTKFKDYDGIGNLLSLNNIKEIKNNSYYLREGMSFYIDYFIKTNAQQLNIMYQILQRQELVLTSNEIGVKKQNVVKLENVDEKHFAKAILTDDLIFKRLTISNLNVSDFNLIRDVFYKKINVESLEDLKNNESIKNRKLTSFNSYKSNSKENIINEFHFLSSHKNYLEDIKKHALIYQNSAIKRIFNYNEDKMAYFITGALYPLKDMRINHKCILETYKERGISYELIGKEVKEFELDGDINQMFFYIKNFYKNMALEENNLMAIELNKYLKKIDWNDTKNKGFNFTLLEMYIILPRLMSAEYVTLSTLISNDNEKNKLSNYKEILKGYLLSKSEYDRKNEFKAIFIDLGLIDFFEKTNNEKEIFDLLEVSNIHLKDLNEYDFKNKKSFNILKKIINIKDFLENKKVPLTCIDIIDNNLIVKESHFSYLFGTSVDFLNLHCKKFTDVSIIKQYNQELTISQKVYKIPLKNFQFNGEELKRGFFEYLLSISVKMLDSNISFNSYLQNKKLKEKLSNMENEMDNLRVKKKV